MENNIKDMKNFNIVPILNSFYNTLDKIIRSHENGSNEMSRVIRRNFEESYSQFSIQLNRMVEGMVEQSKIGNSNAFKTIDFSQEVNRILNSIMIRSREGLMSGNFKEAMVYDIVGNSFNSIKEALSLRMNNEYKKAVELYLNKDKQNSFQLSPEEMKRFKEQEKRIYSKSEMSEKDKVQEERENEFQALEEDVII